MLCMGTIKEWSIVRYFIREKKQSKSCFIMTSYQEGEAVWFPGNVLLQQVITDGDLEEMKQLINAYGKAIVNEPEPTGLYPVMRCVFEGQLGPLCLLVECGADLMVQDGENWTVLHVAASMDNVDAAKVILNNCTTCLTQVCNVDGEIPIDLAESTQMASLLADGDVKVKRTDTVKEMAKDETAILTIVRRHTAFKANHETLNVVLQNSSNYDSLLHLAASKNYPRLASSLLSNRLCKLELRDREGRTALQTAVYHKSIDMMLLLVVWM